MSATGGPETFIESGDETFKFAWAPDGQEVAYGYYDMDLFKANADGTAVTPLISSLSRRAHRGRRRDASGAPDWSSNGRDIVFMADTDYGQSLAALFVVGPNGYDVATYVPNSDHMVGRAIPEWSPDGTRFAFSSDGGDIDGPVEIMVLNPDGSGPGVITAGNPAESGDPHWSPDGSRLVYSRQIRSTYPNVTSGLHTINPDGTGDAVLTSGAWQDGSADWQPLRALDPYPRPGGASPLVVYLVSAYEQVHEPEHPARGSAGEGSCTPPVQTSDLLTTSKVGRGKGFVRLDTVVGNPGTTADEADVGIRSEISDVRNASDQSDYAGNVILRLRSRVTDRAGGGFGGLSVTSQDFRFDVPISCTPSAPAPNGSDCSVSTTADSLWPGFIKEGKRMVMSTWEISVLDAGADGDIGGPPDCPRFCGTGDEQRFLEQGTFTP